MKQWTITCPDCGHQWVVETGDSGHRGFDMNDNWDDGSYSRTIGTPCGCEAKRRAARKAEAEAAEAARHAAACEKAVADREAYLVAQATGWAARKAVTVADLGDYLIAEGGYPVTAEEIESFASYYGWDASQLWLMDVSGRPWLAFGNEPGHRAMLVAK